MDIGIVIGRFRRAALIASCGWSVHKAARNLAELLAGRGRSRCVTEFQP
jgi:hypothetical protein